MPVNKGVLVFRGDKGKPSNHYSKSMISNVIDDAALGVLATALAAHSDCNVAKRSFVSSTAINDTAPGSDVNVDRKAILYFRDPTDLSTHSVTIPAPVAADCEITESGERLTAAAVTDITALINTATGKSYTGLFGVVIQPR